MSCVLFCTYMVIGAGLLPLWHWYGFISRMQHQQRRDLQAGCDIIVSTPGRLLDLCEEGCCDLSEVSFMILDEADRMLDLYVCVACLLACLLGCRWFIAAWY